MTGQDVGVIIPPPEIRVMIDKTANFVASNGAKLEKKVFASLNANPKFSFILPTDNYHSYYRQQLEKALEANKEYKIEDDDEEEEDEKSLLASSSAVNNAPPEPPKPDSSLTKKEEERKSLLDKLRSGKPTQTAPEQPPKPLFILNIPYTQITALDLDIIKLTAQFVARNGDQFRGGLLNREMRNPQFDFMKVGHHANALFNSLVDTYQRVLYPPRDIVDQLSKTLNNKSSFLEGLLKKAEWEKYVIQSEKLNDPDKEEQSRAPIDWHSFIIVETITFDENEVLPAPISFTQPNQADQNDDMEMDMEDSETSIPLHHPTERKIVKNYQPSFERNKRTNAFQKCTICGQDIPVDEFDEHVKIELLDPRFAVQRKSNAEKVLHSSLAQPTSIVKRLEELQYHRTDIFGDDEVEIGKTIEGEDKPRISEKNIWDGHTASARSAIPSAQLAGKTIQEQIEAIHEAKGIKGDKPEVGPIIRPIVGPPVMNLGQHPQHPSHLLSDPSRGGMGYPMPGMPFMPYQMPGMPQMPTLPPTPVVAHDPYPPLSSDEPPFKKQKPLEWSDHLIPEAEFLSSHPEPVLLKIYVPKQENKQGWLLDGQTIEISINPSESVGQLKSTIAEKLNLPANKQNLRVENMPFLKDKDSLAFYNLDESKEISLGIKERGKRKK